jgi:hypothetical protein
MPLECAYAFFLDVDVELSDPALIRMKSGTEVVSSID